MSGDSMFLFNKMGEQLICKLNPTSDMVKRQLSQLRDQWQTLKQTAANQTRALGGVKSLQEFSRKVDKLETWIKEKVTLNTTLWRRDFHANLFTFHRRFPPERSTLVSLNFFLFFTLQQIYKISTQALRVAIYTKNSWKIMVD